MTALASFSRRSGRALLRLLGCVLLLGGGSTAAPAYPSTDTSLGAVLEGFTAKYRSSVVFVRAVRPIGPDPRSLSVFGAMSTGPATETLWSTGVVIDREGRVLTCADGAQPTDRIVLVTADGQELPARFVAQDAPTGLALLEAADGGGELTPLVRCASAAATRENDWVVVLGPGPSDVRLEPRLGRLEEIVPAPSAGGVTFLRIDAEGASGGCGALVLDGNGDFVGMLVDCDARVAGASDAVASVLDEPVLALPRGFLLETAHRLADPARASVGFLGVQPTLRSLAEADVERAAVSSSPVEVLRVLPGSPAEQGGLLAGDLLLSLDGFLIEDVNQVSERVSACRPGATVALQILRDGVQQTVFVVLGDRSSLEWLDRRYRRNLRRESLLEGEIRLLEDELETLRTTQERFR